MLLKEKLKKKISKKNNKNIIVNSNNNILKLLKKNVFLLKNKKKYIFLFSGISSFIFNSKICYTHKAYKKSLYSLNFYKRKYYIKKNKKKNNFCLYYNKSLFFSWKRKNKNKFFTLKLRKRKINKKKNFYISNKFKFLNLINFEKNNNKNKILISNNFSLFSFFQYSTLKTFFLLSKDYNNYNNYITNNKLFLCLQKFKENNNIFFQFYKNMYLFKNKENNKIIDFNIDKKISKILLIIKKNYRSYFNLYIKKIKKKKFIYNFNKNLLYLRHYKNNNLIFKNNPYFYNYINHNLSKNNIINKNSKYNLKYLNILNYILTKNNIHNLNKKYLLNKNYLIHNLKYLWSWFLIYFMFTLNKNKNQDKVLYLNSISKRLFNLNSTSNNNINLLNTNILNNTKIYNNNLYLFHNKYKLLLKYIIKNYSKYYQTNVNNKIFNYTFIKRKYNKGFKYKTTNIVKIFKKNNYFNTRKYNIKKFSKIWLKISKYINKNNKKIKNINYFGIVTINICLNNTYITLTDLEGKVISVLCGGLLKIKGPKRSTNVASETIAYKMASLIKNKNIQFIILKLNGILHTRKMKSALKAIRTGNYAIIKCINITPKAHNGIRRKKRKRL
jgi:small subunit ribosomal protein S11